MEIHIITAFPNMFSSIFSESIIHRAQTKNTVNINIHDLRKWTTDKHKTIDSKPYGGGAGMVMKVEPIYKALKNIRETTKDKKVLTILTSAKGQVFNQQLARDYSTYEVLIIICGHYEGVDERVKEYIDIELSIGEFVLTGGELPAMVIIDSIVRLLPGVLGNEKSLQDESYNTDGYTESPHFTRPAIFTDDDGRELKVPDVLLSGHHKEIEKFKKG